MYQYMMCTYMYKYMCMLCMYMCVCVCVYTYALCIHTHIHTHTHIHAFIQTYKHTYMHAYIVHTCTRTHTHTYAQTTRRQREAWHTPTWWPLAKTRRHAFSKVCSHLQCLSYSQSVCHILKSMLTYSVSVTFSVCACVLLIVHTKH
jgi:hypothetical protein